MIVKSVLRDLFFGLGVQSHLRFTEKRADFWLRDVCTSAYFASVTAYGGCYYSGASNAHGVRPCFNLYQVLTTVSCNRAWWWLRDICTSAFFAFVTDGGGCLSGSASGASGVRPCFNLSFNVSLINS